MNAEALSRKQPLALAYLEQVEALTAEITAGMEAIEANALSTFEQSVCRQQEICTELSQLHTDWGSEDAGAEKSGVHSGFSDRILDERIRLAAQSLHRLNSQYAALLKHSGESVRLFAGLCRSYTGQFQNVALAGAGRPSWISEL